MGLVNESRIKFWCIVIYRQRRVKKYLLDNNPAVMVISQNGYFKKLEKLFKRAALCIDRKFVCG